MQEEDLQSFSVTTTDIHSVANSTTGDDVYPNIKSLTIRSHWKPLIRQHEDDILHLKKFTNLKFLHIDAPFDLSPNFVTNSNVLRYIDSSIPFSEIVFSTVRFNLITKYLDIYCNAFSHSSQLDRYEENNIKQYDLFLYFAEGRESFGGGDMKVLFKRHNQESNGEIYFCIGSFGGGFDDRIWAARCALTHSNDAINYLDLKPSLYSGDEYDDIDMYILGLDRFSACNNFSINNGIFGQEDEGLNYDIDQEGRINNINWMKFTYCHFYQEGARF